jgi:hypothetical protein
VLSEEIDPALLTRPSPDSDVNIAHPVVLPALDETIATTVGTFPQLEVLYGPESRSRLGILGGAMIVGAIILLGRPSRCLRSIAPSSDTAAFIDGGASN